MKIDTKYIIEICNWSHPDFGTFAKFLNDLSKNREIEIAQPTVLYLCDECTRPLMLKNGPCLYCMGVKDGKKNDPFGDHKHCWTVSEKPHCIGCGVFKKFAYSHSSTT